MFFILNLSCSWCSKNQDVSYNMNLSTEDVTSFNEHQSRTLTSLLHPATSMHNHKSKSTQYIMTYNKAFPNTSWRTWRLPLAWRYRKEKRLQRLWNQICIQMLMLRISYTVKQKYCIENLADPTRHAQNSYLEVLQHILYYLQQKRL